MKKTISILIIALILVMAVIASGSSMPPAPADRANGAPGMPPDGMGAPPDGMGAPPDGMGAPPDGTPPGGFGGMPGGPGRSSADIDYAGAVEITSADAQSGQTYASTTADESALLIRTSDAVEITNPTVTKSGDSDGGDNCNFYGLNAAMLLKDGTTTTIRGGTVNSDASGANGVFCYGGNGVETSGRSSAAIRTDRGGGTVVVDGGSYTSNGLGSPAIYSTADITVSNAALTSNLSEGVCIEGLNSITLNNCDLTADNTKCNGNATFLDSIMIYQSMSGDADSGTSFFTMNGGKLTSKNGHVFHVTNTSAVITLNGVEIVNEDADNILLSVCADGWNGDSNKALVKAASQKLSGSIKVGNDSVLALGLTDGSTFEGSIDGSIVNASGTVVSTETGAVSVTLDSTSTWTLTGDSYITEFNGDLNNVNRNGYTLYVNGEALA